MSDQVTPDPITISEASDLITLTGPIHDPSDSNVKKGVVLLEINSQGYIRMKDDPNPRQGWDHKFVKYKGKSFFIAIEYNSIIEIILTGETKWSFNVNEGLLTFKRPSDGQWYRVVHSPSQNPVKNLLLHAIPSGKEQDTDEACHSFNLMVNFSQILPDDTDGRAWPVKIDPDAKNPPPNGSLNVDDREKFAPALGLGK